MFSEEEIIEECIKGNRKAEKHLYTKYNGLFFAICLRYTQSREEAEDVLITGFTSIFESLPMYKKQGSFEGWMKRIIINTAVNHYRTNKKHLSNIDIEEIDTINEISQKSYQDINVKDILNQIQMMLKDINKYLTDLPLKAISTPNCRNASYSGKHFEIAICKS